MMNFNFLLHDHHITSGAKIIRVLKPQTEIAIATTHKIFINVAERVFLNFNYTYRNVVCHKKL